HGQTIEKYDMTAALDDLTFKPRALEQPMQHINGLLHAVDGKLTTGHINAVFGQDEFQLVSLTVPLDDVSKKIEFRDIALSINFHQPSPHYPNGLGRVIARLNPAGTYTLSGSYAIVYHGPNESNLVLTSDNSALAVGEQRMAITNLHADILLGPEQAQIRKFDGTLLGGTIAGTGMVGTRHPTQYDLNLTLRNIDMQQFSTAFALPTSNQAQLNGNADANLLFRGVEDDLNSISGRGDLRITDGQLWDMSLINGMASRTKIGRQALTAGEAAAMFEIANSQVQIIAAAINSPALGLEGNGTIGFDGKIDLNVIAAPFGDWEKEFKKTGIPIVSNIAGNVAGSIQKIVNSATSQLLYQFHVTGTIAQPQVEAVPSPMLNDAGASIFEKMREKKESLLESLRQWRK
ncbi:MAG TPA: AsmA-like C-terminal region-containing protein, partial [Tepidisphaeraceae bacterium]|nr:AsmA-like C-terminal region-containing protein [Tepidisphaeraceae bacterium]